MASRSSKIKESIVRFVISHSLRNQERIWKTTWAKSILKISVKNSGTKDTQDLHSSIPELSAQFANCLSAVRIWKNTWKGSIQKTSVRTNGTMGRWTHQTWKNSIRKISSRSSRMTSVCRRLLCGNTSQDTQRGWLRKDTRRFLRPATSAKGWCPQKAPRNTWTLLTIFTKTQ